MQPVDKVTYDKVVSQFDELMRILHPFMPFITEEIWQLLADRKTGKVLWYH
jgi:valyl-tRNA synthetase